MDVSGAVTVAHMEEGLALRMAGIVELKAEMGQMVL
jgi:hypothetical protein